MHWVLALGAGLTLALVIGLDGTQEREYLSLLVWVDLLGRGLEDQLSFRVRLWEEEWDFEVERRSEMRKLEANISAKFS